MREIFDSIIDILEGMIAKLDKDRKELLRPASPPTSELLRASVETCKKQDNELLRGSNE